MKIFLNIILFCISLISTDVFSRGTDTPKVLSRYDALTSVMTYVDRLGMLVPNTLGVHPSENHWLIDLYAESDECSTPNKEEFIVEKIGGDPELKSTESSILKPGKNDQELLSALQKVFVMVEKDASNAYRDLDSHFSSCVILENGIAKIRYFLAPDALYFNGTFQGKETRMKRVGGGPFYKVDLATSEIIEKIYYQ